METKRLLIDTNVVLDFLLARKPYDIPARKILELSAEGRLRLFIGINSFTDIIYFVQKQYDIDVVREKMTELLDFLTIIEAGHKDALRSLKMTDFDDIEDALQAQCAEKENIDFIITRNIKDFENSKITAILPDEFLEKLNI